MPPLSLPIGVSNTLNTNSPGTYSLIYSAANFLGAVGIATRTVVVKDTQPPSVTLQGANPVVVQAGTPFVDPGATATDLCAGDLTFGIISNLTVNISVPGTYTNTYSVMDPSGNSAHTNRIVTVVPPTPPLFAACSVTAPGQLRLQGTGTPGLTYTLQTSTNLVDWVNHTNLVPGPDGLIDYSDQPDPAAPACFYRLRWP